MSYPLPKMEDLITKLQGADTFVILDLIQAYLQLELDDNTKNMLVINTPWGLHENRRLVFGISCSSFIF